MTIGPHIWETHRLLTMFEKVKYQHIKRGGNRVAHLIAKEGFLWRQDVQWVEDRPSAMLELVEAEAPWPD